MQYAEALIQHGRDHYGREASPLIAVTLDRNTLELPGEEIMLGLQKLERSSWGIRNHDRMLTGANPMHDQNLYQILYALSHISGDPRYSAEADSTLAWFFGHCQSAATGLMAWGEHIGWDFQTETITGGRETHNHEFYRPWVLWDKSYDLAPEAYTAFARGLWRHQIYDQQTGDFSRHAEYKTHKPGRNSQYPRHGGFYIATWAEAYSRTGDAVFLRAVEVLVGFFERHRNPLTGAIPAEVGNKRSNNMLMWPQSNLSLAVDLHDAASKLPNLLGGRMHALARSIDSVYSRTSHELHNEGRGFVVSGNTETLRAEDVRDSGQPAYTDLWATGYGQATDAAAGNICVLRYRQTGSEYYKDFVIASANRYLDADPDLLFPLYPGTMGDVIYLLLAAYEISQEIQYLRRADDLAQTSLHLFFDQDNPLPKASSHHDHYEAITRADTLMMAMLKLWAIHYHTSFSASLLWCDR
jgi:hypothetical protein